MIEIEGITSEPFQRHVITTETGNVTLVLKYHDVIQQWTLDAERNGKAVHGVKLATGVRHIESSLLGVDFVVVSEFNLDPFLIDDFQAGRCKLVMVQDGTI
jgi:hypothetical protein